MPGGDLGGQKAADTSWVRTKYLDVANEIHGGGFFIGEESGQIGPMLAGRTRGYALASLGYRLSGEATFPAGGNLSAMAATSGDVASLVDPALGNVAVSDAVQAAVDWFGPICFSTMGATNSSSSAESKCLGKIIGTAEAQPLVEAASPQTYISRKSPPMYVQRGIGDR